MRAIFIERATLLYCSVFGQRFLGAGIYPRGEIFAICKLIGTPMSKEKKTVKYHKAAAEHHEEAAKHHRKAAEYHEKNLHEKAAHHAHSAHGHASHADESAKEASKDHAELHGKMDL
jgi:hypothetical protein